MFKDLYQYLDGVNTNSMDIANNVKVNYSNPCVYVGSTIILIAGLLIIGYQIYKSIKEKKNASIENEVIENQN